MCYEDPISASTLRTFPFPDWKYVGWSFLLGSEEKPVLQSLFSGTALEKGRDRTSPKGRSLHQHMPKNMRMEVSAEVFFTFFFGFRRCTVVIRFFPFNENEPPFHIVTLFSPRCVAQSKGPTPQTQSNPASLFHELHIHLNEAIMQPPLQNPHQQLQTIRSIHVAACVQLELRGPGHQDQVLGERYVDMRPVRVDFLGDLVNGVADAICNVGVANGFAVFGECDEEGCVCYCE